MAGPEDRALEALRRLLAEGSTGGQAKVDALMALIQRAVWVPTWGPGDEGFRTLVNSNGETALCVFTGRDTLGHAAARFGWAQPDRSIPAREAGAREPLRYALAHDLRFVVVDISSPHALEIDRGEIEPLIHPAVSSDASGPYAGMGRVSSSVLRAVQPTPSPEDADPGHAEIEGGTENGARAATVANDPPAGVDATTPPAGSPGTRASVPPSFSQAGGVRDEQPSSGGMPAAPATGGGVSAQDTPSAGEQTLGIVPLGSPPHDDLLEAWSAVLREYPEVEWAAYGMVRRGEGEATPMVGLRIDTTYRARVREIANAVQQAATSQQTPLEVILLDNPELMRVARHRTLVFYPWRREPRNPRSEGT